MSINNVSNMNKADLVKLALEKKGVSVKQTQKPAYLTMNGSIFAATKLNKTTNTRDAIANQNINKSLSDLTTSAKTNKEKSNNEGSEINRNMSVSEGKAAIADAKSKQKQVSDLTKTTERDNKTVTRFNKKAQELEQDINKKDNAFQKAMEKEQTTFTNAQMNIEKTITDIETNDNIIQALNNELDSLTAGDNTGVGATSAFSLSLGSAVQEKQQKDNNNGNSEKINNIQTKIKSRISLGEAYGAKIKTLQKISYRSYARMNKMSQSHIKTQKANQKQIQNNQNETSGIIKFAEKTDQISQLVTQAGQTLNYAGQGMVALGSIIVTGGQALIAVGSVMQKIGKVGVLVGNYGSAAANITKTVAYAAEGNLKGALISAGSAIQSGAAAIASTKSLKSDLNAIDSKANAATNKTATAKTETATGTATAKTGTGTAENTTAKAKSKTKSDENDDIFEKLKKYGSALQALASQLPDNNNNSKYYSNNNSSYSMSPLMRQYFASHQRRSASIAERFKNKRYYY